MLFEHTVLVVTSENPLTTDCLKAAMAPFQDPIATKNSDYCVEYSILKRMRHDYKIYCAHQGVSNKLSKLSFKDYLIFRFGPDIEVLPFAMKLSSTNYGLIVVADDDSKKIVDVVIHDNPNKKWSNWDLASDVNELLPTKSGESAIALLSEIDVETARFEVAKKATENYEYLLNLVPDIHLNWKKFSDILNDKSIPNMHDKVEIYKSQKTLMLLREADKEGIFFGERAIANIDDYIGNLDSIILNLQSKILLKQSILDARDIQNPKWIDATKTTLNNEWAQNFSDFITELNPNEYITVVRCQYDQKC